eukprot:g35605.t1
MESLLMVVDLLQRLDGVLQSGFSSTVQELCRWCRHGGEQGALDAGRVEVFGLLVEKLAPGAEDRDVSSSLRDLAVGWCLPLLRHLQLEEPSWRLVYSLCGLLHACCRQAPPTLLRDVTTSSLSDLRSYTEERGRAGLVEGKGARSGESQVPEYSDIRVAVEVLVRTAPLLLLEPGAGAQELLPLALTAVRVGEDSVASRMVTGLIPALLWHPGSSVSKCPSAQEIWDRVKHWGKTGSVFRSLLLLSSLPPHLLFGTGDRPSPDTFDLRICLEFWELVQTGLVQPDNTSRKRAMYLLKRAVEVSNTLRSEIRSESQAES